jgi:hypothetical protein
LAVLLVSGQDVTPSMEMASMICNMPSTMTFPSASVSNRSTSPHTRRSCEAFYAMRMASCTLSQPSKGKLKVVMKRSL